MGGRWRRRRIVRAARPVAPPTTAPPRRRRFTKSESRWTSAEPSPFCPTEIVALEGPRTIVELRDAWKIWSVLTCQPPAPARVRMTSRPGLECHEVLARGGPAVICGPSAIRVSTSVAPLGRNPTETLLSSRESGRVWSAATKPTTPAAMVTTIVAARSSCLVVLPPCRGSGTRAESITHSCGEIWCSSLAPLAGLFHRCSLVDR